MIIIIVQILQSKDYPIQPDGGATITGQNVLELIIQFKVYVKWS